MNTIEKANLARRLKDNPDFTDLLNLIEADIFEAFKNTEINDAEKLGNVHALSHGLKLLKNRVTKYIEIADFEASKSENY